MFYTSPGLSKVTTEESIRTFFTTTYPECVLENIELIMTKIEDTAPGDQPVHRCDIIASNPSIFPILPSI